MLVVIGTALEIVSVWPTQNIDAVQNDSRLRKGKPISSSRLNFGAEITVQNQRANK